jgi:hypothetical protein
MTEDQNMLGFYEGFTETVHKAMRFVTSISNRSLQQKLIAGLHALNTQTYDLEKVTDPSIHGCRTNFEFGIAENDGFNYLNDDETARVLKAVGKKPLEIIDLFCVVRYHRSRGGKETSLKFDYWMIRLVFNKRLMDAYVFHERGPGYTSAGDVVNVVASKVNETCMKKVLKESFLTSPLEKAQNNL